MRKIFILIVLFINFLLSCFGNTFQGGVEKEIVMSGNSVVDHATNIPISGAIVSLPLDNYTTKTDSKGMFSLNANVSGPTVLSVEKEGYKPFSITIDKLDKNKPLIIGIEQSSVKDMILDTDMFHLGDNSFSPDSANSGDFRIRAVGPFYSKSFKLNRNISRASLVIGSIIGIDTKMAKLMGQNKIVRAYSSPPEVFFNGVKISEIQLNGDNQRIKLPQNLIRRGRENQITIKTGRNMLSDMVDYDDIEIMNISVETE